MTSNQPLEPCAGCARHIRVGESACPFCGAAHAAVPTTATLAEEPSALSRAAILLLGASLALGACERPTATERPTMSPSEQVNSQPATAAIYGAAPTPVMPRVVVPPAGPAVAAYGSPAPPPAPPTPPSVPPTP